LLTLNLHSSILITVQECLYMPTLCLLTNHDESVTFGAFGLVNVYDKFGYIVNICLH
jgi:hypothetical protein